MSANLHCCIYKPVERFLVYYVIAIFGDHVTAQELRVKVTWLTTYLQAKWRLNQSKSISRGEKRTRDLGFFM